MAESGSKNLQWATDGLSTARGDFTRLTGRYLSQSAGWPAIPSLLFVFSNKRKPYSAHVNNFWPMKWKQECWVELLGRLLKELTWLGGIPFGLFSFFCLAASDGLKEFVRHLGPHCDLQGGSLALPMMEKGRSGLCPRGHRRATGQPTPGFVT